jgi:hypothetical protein
MCISHSYGVLRVKFILSPIDLITLILLVEEYRLRSFSFRNPHISYALLDQDVYILLCIFS